MFLGMKMAWKQGVQKLIGESDSKILIDMIARYDKNDKYPPFNEEYSQPSVLVI